MRAANAVPPVWDIFCRVVDNYGDAGVCWRLALILHREHRLQVQLWLDDLATLHKLVPDVDPQSVSQQVEGISILHWSTEPGTAQDATVVVEAFGCGLPEAYVARMAGRARPPLWIVLEYLSAESWVDGHHGLASPHPRLPLPRYFFFPGFTAATGGLLREADLPARRAAFDAAACAAFWKRLGFDAPAPSALTVSLFAYADAPVAGLLSAMAAGAEPVIVVVPDGLLLPAVRSFFGDADATTVTWQRDALQVRALPFLPQVQYDELLWACAVNFVRGEDSFTRALWAARPLVWQPYRQADDVHLQKLSAFLDRYCTGLLDGASEALQGLWRAWNGGTAGWQDAAWRDFRAERAVLTVHARRWAEKAAVSGEMAAGLVKFARIRVE